MTKSFLAMTDALHGYLLDHSLREPPALAALREETAALPRSRMQIAPEQGQLMALLVKLIGARACLEVGTFTGYSALAVALALPADGRLVTLDIDPDTTRVARRHWAGAGVDGKIELRLGPATESLEALLAEDGPGSFDAAFIDADKPNYDAYYEAALELVRPGGLIMIDNVLWSGRVADASNRDPDTEALRALNTKLRDDARIDLVMLPMADGLSLARKR